MNTSPRGFTLLISLVLTGVILAVAIALADLAYKQIVFSSVARQSQIAFYNADSAIECALYWDQKYNHFGFSKVNFPNITCGNQSIAITNSGVSGGIRTTSFSIATTSTQCPSGGTLATVTIRKTNGTATCNSVGSTNCIFAAGYNTCNASDPRRIERGLKVQY